MDNNNGWIKLHRKLTEWEWFKDSKTLHLFIYLLVSANHKPNKWKGITIDRGQILTGRKSLSIVTGIGEQSIRTSLERLKSTNEITIKSTSLYSIISICNYNTYQDDKKEINQVINQQANQQLTSHQPATNQQLTTNKNDNNVKNEKNKEKHGQFQNVLLLPEEYLKLQELYGEDKTKALIENLSTGIESKGYKYKSHYATILNWEKREQGKKPETNLERIQRLMKE